MNKEELVDQVATDTGQTKKQAMVTVDAVFASITSALRRGDGWSGRRESNPHSQLGRLALYH